jgi:leader peptidase (prepilin peptidase)/N-methyltransferase
LLSYLLLRGKCSSCGTGISIRYPVVEFATAALFLVAAWHFGPTTEGLAAILLTGFLVALTGIDVDHQLLPDILTLPLLWIGILLSLGHVFVGPESSIAGAAVGYLALWSIFWIFFGLTRLIHGEGKEGMGYGDFKLLAALGAWLGWTAVPLIIFLSAIAGAVYGGAMLALARHKLGKPMPYGPFIAAAGWVAMIWGELIIEQYLHFSGLG